MESLERLGYSSFFADQMNRLARPEFVPARIVSQGRAGYEIAGCRAHIAKLRGRLLHDLAGEDRPVVGDWVAVIDDGQRAVIQQVLRRRTAMTRRAAGSETERQVVAANVDLFFIVTSANRDFNLRRIERYLAAVWNSGARPAVILNKVDLARSDEAAMIQQISDVAIGVPVLATSAVSGEGLDELRKLIAPGSTVGLVGSSGVGKSSLVNKLMGDDQLSVAATRRDEKGRHTTTRRELLELQGGGVLIDTPGMRELGLTDDRGGIDSLFVEIAALAPGCRFNDCRHDGEPGCAVAAAVAAGELPPERLASYHRLRREIATAERRREPEQARNTKRRWKAIHKHKRVHFKNNPQKKRR